MAWTYLAESGDLVLRSPSGSNQPRIVRSTGTVKECSLAEWQAETSELHPSGTTSAHFLWSPLEEKWTSSSVDFPARTLALQELERAWKESEADCFTRCLEPLARLSRDGSSWRMCQRLPLAGDVMWSGKLPRWGMTVDGVLYQQHPLEPCIDAKGGSYWLTPSTMEHLPVRQGAALERALHRGNSTSRRRVSGRLNEQVAYPEMYPTPTVNDAKNKAGPAQFRRDSPGLNTIVMMATPTTSQANKPVRRPSPSRAKGEHGDDLQDSVGRLHAEMIGKRLCPRWVSVLMGYPTWWTDLEDSVMPWFLNKPKKRLKS